jgi:hypothetical protein
VIGDGLDPLGTPQDLDLDPVRIHQPRGPEGAPQGGTGGKVPPLTGGFRGFPPPGQHC